MSKPRSGRQRPDKHDLVTLERELRQLLAALEGAEAKALERGTEHSASTSALSRQLVLQAVQLGTLGGIVSSAAGDLRHLIGYFFGEGP